MKYLITVSELIPFVESNYHLIMGWTLGAITLGFFAWLIGYFILHGKYSYYCNDHDTWSKENEVCSECHKEEITEVEFEPDNADKLQAVSTELANGDPASSPGEGKE